MSPVSERNKNPDCPGHRKTMAMHMNKTDKKQNGKKKKKTGCTFKIPTAKVQKVSAEKIGR